jgi:uncharacterized membrane protein YqaE (UPF0057 family)
MSKLLLVIIAIFLPPLAIFLKDGLGNSFWINLILTIVGFYVLGLIHALYVILSDKAA